MATDGKETTARRPPPAFPPQSESLESPSFAAGSLEETLRGLENEFTEEICHSTAPSVNIGRGERDALHSNESGGLSEPDPDVPMDIDEGESAAGPGGNVDQALVGAPHSQAPQAAMSAIAGGGVADAGGASEEDDEDASFRAWAENAGDSDEGGEDADAFRAPAPEGEVVGAGVGAREWEGQQEVEGVGGGSGQGGAEAEGEGGGEAPPTTHMQMNQLVLLLEIFSREMDHNTKLALLNQVP